MNFYLIAKAYNSYGNHTTLSLIPDFLLEGSSSFGDAVKQITVTFHFATSGPPKKTLEQLFETHHRHRSTLPKIVFHRKKGSMVIDVSSDLMDGRDWKPSPTLVLPLFRSAVGETIAALSRMKTRLKVSDAFDLNSFLAHCESARDRIPLSSEDLQMLGERLKSARIAKTAALSPWEKLGIDWTEFHASAREFLDVPFLWDSANEFSPNGNDTGADLLSDYRKWIKQHEGGQPSEFLKGLIKRWGYSTFDQLDDETQSDVAIALAFAEIKLRGCCDDEVRQMAIKAVDRQRLVAEQAPNWVHQKDRLDALKIVEEKLRYLDTI